MNAVVPVPEEAIRDQAVAVDVLPGDELLPAEVPKPPVAVVTPPALPAVPEVCLMCPIAIH